VQPHQENVPTREDSPPNRHFGDRSHEHQNGFRHLDAPLDGLKRNYDLGWKFESNTDGPPGWKGDPYLLLYVSFATTSGARPRSGTLHFALTRGRWHHITQVSDRDRDALLELAKQRGRLDLAALEEGSEPPWLDAGKHLHLIPRTREAPRWIASLPGSSPKHAGCARMLNQLAPLQASNERGH
jgi:hypothetical protein